jgi:hypothetical protein
MSPAARIRRTRVAVLVALAVAACAVPVAFLPVWGSSGGRLLPLAAVPVAGVVAAALAARLLRDATARGGPWRRADVALLVAGVVAALVAVPALLAAVVLVGGP